MAVYTHNEVVAPPALEWIELTATITSISPTQVVLTNSDGTLTVLTGSDFLGTTGTGGTLTQGTVTAAARTDATNTVIFETLTGFSLPALDFSAALAQFGIQGPASAALGGNDTFNGFSGDDFFKGFAGNDTMNGGPGIDTVRYSGPFHSGPINVQLGTTSTVTGNATAGVDTLVSVERIIGSNANAGDDYVVGAGFAGSLGPFNAFEGRGGNDRITGNGSTRLFFVEATGAVTVDLVAGTAVGDASVGSDTFTGVNSIFGSPSGDSITGDGNNNFFIGFDGNDTLVGAAGNDTLIGGLGNDVFIGGAGNDQFIGSAGIRDVADYSTDAANGAAQGIRVNQWAGGTLGGIPADTVFDGFGGTDSIENVIDITATQFDDVVLGGNNNNRLELGGGADTAFGNLGNDTIIGGPGNDTIDGSIGADSMFGNQGADVFFVDNIDDVVTEVAEAGAFDTIWTTVSFTLPANAEILIAQNGAGNINGIGNDDVTLMLGNEGNNNLSTLGGNDIALGLAGNDTIDGGAGFFDVISGGDGADSLTGGTGHDFFSFESITQGGDVITDFTTTVGDNLDILDLRPLWQTFSNFGEIFSVLDAVAFGHFTFVQVGADTQVLADPDGGSAGFEPDVVLVTLRNTDAALVQALTLII